MNTRHQASRSYFERASDANDIYKADVSLPALDSADVRPMQLCAFGQGLLGKPKGKPLFADGLAKLNARIGGHALMFSEQRR